MLNKNDEVIRVYYMTPNIGADKVIITDENNNLIYDENLALSYSTSEIAKRARVRCKNNKDGKDAFEKDEEVMIFSLSDFLTSRIEQTNIGKIEICFTIKRKDYEKNFEKYEKIAISFTEKHPGIYSTNNEEIRKITIEDLLRENRK